MLTRPAQPRFFSTAAAFGDWLAKRAAKSPELIVGFYKVGSGRPSMTWPESVDEALCHGWIDGVRKRIDDSSYQIRFTPRKATSTWSAINIARVGVLQHEGRMQPAGLEAFSRRRAAASRIYAYEQADAAVLGASDEAEFRTHKAAWAFFQTQPARYRHLVIWRIATAKRPETRRTRLDQLIAASQASKRL